MSEMLKIENIRKETGICIYAVFRDRWSDHLLPCAEHHFVAEIPIG